jgi:hypothetical protein
MPLVGTPNHRGTTLQVVGVAGVNDNDIVIEVDDVSRFNEFALSSSAGAMDVDVSLDGTNFITAIALEDKKSVAPGTRVVVTAAAGLYYFEGNFKAVRVRQNAATAVANAVLTAGQKGRTR